MALGGIIVLFLIRQALALNENVMLYQAIRDLNKLLEVKVADRTEKLESANKELKIEVQERKKAENSHRESQQLMSDIISFLPEAIMAIDLNGKVMIWNRAMEVLPGSWLGISWERETTSIPCHFTDTGDRYWWIWCYSP